MPVQPTLWGPTRAAVYYGCLQLVGEDISAVYSTLQTRTTQLQEAVLQCLEKSNWNLSDIYEKASSLKEVEDKSELKEILDNCMFKVNNMTQPQVKELLTSNRTDGGQASSNPFDIYSTFYSPLGSLLYVGSQRGHTALVKMLADPLLDMLEVAHVSAGETPLYAAVKNWPFQDCNYKVCWFLQ